MTLTHPRAPYACALLAFTVLSVGSLLAQEPAPAAQQPPATAPGPAFRPAAPKPEPPALAEVLELRRSNFILRQNLLTAQMQNLQNMINRENAEIAALRESLKKDVEKAHPGWTLGEDGTVVAAKSAEKK